MPRRARSPRSTRLRTPLCERLGIEVPLVIAPFGPWDEVELAVATASAGCLASLGTAVRSVPELKQQWAIVRDRTDRPFAINHTGRPVSEDAFAASLDFRPAAISFHVGVPADLIDRPTTAGFSGCRPLAMPREPKRRSRLERTCSSPRERALHAALIGQLEADPDSVDPEVVGAQLLAAFRAGGGYDLLPFAAQLVERLLVEAAAAIEKATSAVRH